MGMFKGLTPAGLFVRESLEITYTSISPPFSVILLNIQFLGYLIKNAFTDIGLELLPMSFVCIPQLARYLCHNAGISRPKVLYQKKAYSPMGDGGTKEEDFQGRFQVN